MRACLQSLLAIAESDAGSSDFFSKRSLSSKDSVPAKK